MIYRSFRRAVRSLAAASVFAAAGSAAAATFTVTNTSDSGPGSLRQAILDANANLGPDVIEFSIGSGVAAIPVPSTLPVVTEQLTIDGTTQPGYAGAPLIWLQGTNATYDGLQIMADNCVVNAISLTGFFGGIHAMDSAGHSFSGNYVGMSPTATAPVRTIHGIQLEDCTNSYVGPSGTVGRNLFAASNQGTYILRGSGHVIQGNWFGLNPAGTGVVPNPVLGFSISAAVLVDFSDNIQIGGDTPDERNVMTGNDQGATIRNSNNVRVQGNYIGPLPSGNAAAFGKRGHGIIAQQMTNSLIGGANPGEGNYICNTVFGINLIFNSSLKIHGNFIGFLPNNNTPFNNTTGIRVGDGDQNTEIGGAGAEGNYIAGNSGVGIDVQVATRTKIWGNTFNVTPANITRVQALSIQVGAGNQVEIGAAGKGNRFFHGTTAILTGGGTGTTIKSNYFGTNEDYTQIRSVIAPITHHGGTGTVIGAVGEGNVFAYAGNQAILVTSGTVSVIGNAIGTDPAGLLDLGNNNTGIYVVNAALVNIRQNRIFNTKPGGRPGLGIDLDPIGGAVNDPLDADAGPNVGQNFPVLASASTAPGGTRVVGTLHSEPNKSFAIEFFSNPTLDPTGRGEGHTFLGTLNVTTDASGDASFNQVVPGGAPGLYVTSTATNLSTPAPATSEFSAAVEITNANTAPIADAGADITVTVPHDGDPNTDTAQFTLDGTGSSDADGDTLSYSWKENGVEVGTTATLNLSRPAGSYTFELTVTDPSGDSSSDIVNVTVEDEPNAAPAANAGANQTLPVPYDGNPVTNEATFTLSGSGSDPDGDTLAFEWSDGVNVIGNTATLSVSRPEGAHTFTLTVTDPYGATETQSVAVTVTAENKPPTIGDGTDESVEIPHDGNPNTDTVEFTLNANAANDPENDTLTYEWTEGAMVVGNAASLTLSRPEGVYSFALKITDPFGESAFANYIVTVQPEPNAAPTVNAGPDTQYPATATNDAMVSLAATGLDADGDPLTYKWFKDGVEIATGASASVTLPAGLHTLVVEATDPYGATGSDVVVIGVHYLWGGFLPPINNDGSSVFKLGSTVPVKFQLDGVSFGAVVTAKLHIAKVSDGIVGTELQPETNVAGDWGNTFRYIDGHYQFNLSTKLTNGLSTGTWQLRVDLGDGYPQRTVLISLK